MKKKITLTLFLVFASCLLNPALAQKMRYVMTKVIDRTGIEHTVHCVFYFYFTNNNREITTDGKNINDDAVTNTLYILSNMGFEYAYTQNGNWIYNPYSIDFGTYQRIKIDINSGTYWQIVLSPDYKILNLKEYWNFESEVIFVFEKQDEPSNTLYR